MKKLDQEKCAVILGNITQLCKEYDVNEFEMMFIQTGVQAITNTLVMEEYLKSRE